MSWLLPVIALLIKLGSKGPVFFYQKKIGEKGKPFMCIKFRTMILNSEADEKDPCITRVGWFLRKTNIDGLPQFFNVLTGDMSIVGPRPYIPADCIRFSFVVSSYQFRNLMRPGITGLSQVNTYYEPATDYENIIIRYFWDAQYVRKAGFWLDIRIIAVTISQGLCNLFVVCSRLLRKKK